MMNQFEHDVQQRCMEKLALSKGTILDFLGKRINQIKRYGPHELWGRAGFGYTKLNDLITLKGLIARNKTPLYEKVPRQGLLNTLLKRTKEVPTESRKEIGRLTASIPRGALRGTSTEYIY